MLITQVRGLTAVFLLLVTLWTVSAQAAGPITGGQLNIPGMEKCVYKNISDVDPQYKNLYLFVCKPDGWKASDSRSVFVYIHGGAFMGGDPSAGAEYCRYFASRGMVGISIEYRVSMMNTDTNKINKWDYWESISDCVEAMRWMRVHAATLGIATNRIAVGGHSAGAMATMGLAYGWKNAQAKYPCGDPNVSCVPDAVFPQNGIMGGLHNWYKKGDPVPPPLLLQCSDRDSLGSGSASIRTLFDTVFAAQPLAEQREYRSDIAPDGSTNYAADHVCFATKYAWQPGARDGRPAMIDLEEWFVSLGFLPGRQTPPAQEKNGFCRIEALNYAERSPRILQNRTNTPVWRISYVKDAAARYLMDCVPASAAAITESDLAKAPRLDYRINITTPGKYYVWANIRSSWETEHCDKYGFPDAPYFFRSKQLRLGVMDGKSERLLAGTLVSTPDGKPSWQRPTADPIVVSVPGVITLKAYAVKPGIRLEQLILTTDAAYVPPLIPSTELVIRGADVTDAVLEERLKDAKGLHILTIFSEHLTEAGLKKCLKNLSDVQLLALCGPQVTDEVLESLNGATELQMLRLRVTKVTSAGIEKLQKSIPACCIEH